MFDWLPNRRALREGLIMTVQIVRLLRVARQARLQVPPEPAEERA